MGLGTQALENYSWIARLFEFSTRVETLGWSHHREAASIKQIAEMLSRNNNLLDGGGFFVMGPSKSVISK